MRSSASSIGNAIDRQVIAWVLTASAATMYLSSPAPNRQRYAEPSRKFAPRTVMRVLPVLGPEAGLIDETIGSE